MLKNYIKIAFRNLKKGKLYSFINIIGLSVAVGICLTIGMYLFQEFSFDRFHSKEDRLYRMVTVFDSDGSRVGLNSARLATELQTNFDEVEGVVRVDNSSEAIRVGDVLFNEEVYTADSTFFELFDFQLLSGNPATVLTRPDNVLISESAAERFFGTTDIISRPIDIRFGQEYETFTVSGLIADPPRTSSLQIDVLIPSRYNSEPSWNTLSTSTFVLLKAGTDVENLTMEMNDLYPELFMYKFQAIREMHFDMMTSNPVGPVTNPSFLYLLSVVSVLILLIACINFTILTIGFTTRRAREVGIRKSFGALRSQLRMQFWGETLFTVMIALLIGLVLTEVFVPVLNLFVEVPVVGVSFSFGFFLIIGSVLVLTAIFAGAYPAFYLSRFQPTEVLKGTLKVEGKQTLMRTLTAFQFSLAIFLIVGTIFMNRQMHFMMGNDLGYDHEQVLMIEGPATPEGQQIVDRLRAILQGNRNVSGVSGSWNRLGSTEGVGFDEQPLIADGSEIQAYAFESDYQLMNLLDVELVEGRYLNENSDELNEVLVNRALVEQFGWDQALGKRVSRMFTFDNAEVVGVIEDFNFQSLHNSVAPLVVNPMPYISTIYIRIGGENIRETIMAVEEGWDVAAPDLPFLFRFLDDEVQRQYDYENQWASVVTIAAFVAILIASLGLFGLATLASVKRRKEISIRKVLGATVAEMVNLLALDYLKPVIIGLVIATPLSWIALNRWLEQFASRISLDWWVFAAAGIFCLLIALATVSWQSVRAALADPAKSLRTE